jgi:four helix bundle protein
MRDYKSLIIWEKARELVKEIYLITEEFPSSEKFSITEQMRRAVISVVANIAEGAGRGSNKDFNRFLDMANGSLFELEAILILAIDLKFYDKDESLMDKINHLQKMIYRFKDSIK